MLVWGLRKNSLAMLVKCLASISTKEPRKRRAQNESSEQASLVPDERSFNFELDRTFGHEHMDATEQLAEVQKAAEEFVEEQRIVVRQCALALKGKQSELSIGLL